MDRLAGTIFMTGAGTTFLDPIAMDPAAGITTETVSGYLSVLGIVTVPAVATSLMADCGCLTRPITGTARAAGTIFMAVCGITIRNATSTSMDADTTGMRAFGSISLLRIVIPLAVGTFTMGWAGMYMGRESIPTAMVAAIFTMKEGGACTQEYTT